MLWNFIIFCSIIVDLCVYSYVYAHSNYYYGFNVQMENFLVFFDPVKHKTPNKVYGIPRSCVEKRIKHSSIQEPAKYPFLHCTQDFLDSHHKKYERECKRKTEEKSRVLHTTHYTLKNVIGNMHGSWSIGKTFVYISRWDYYPFKWPWMYEQRDGQICAHFHEVILTGHYHSRSNFGHCITDLIAPILLLPKDVRERSYVIGSHLRSFPNEFLKIIGFKDEQIIYFNETSWFYADRLHAFSKWRPIANINGEINVVLNKLLMEKLNLDHIVPTKYTVNNRKGKRGIKNINELFTAIQQSFPDKQWNIFNTFEGNISTYAYKYTEIKFLVAPVGSNVYNLVFMKPYTTLCIGSSEIYDFYSIFLALSSHHYYYMFSVPGLKHRSLEEWDWNIEIALNAIKQALDSQKYHLVQY